MKKKSSQIVEHLDILKKSINNIILFGTVGAGKTSLINKICNKDFKTLEFGDSCTRDIQYGFSLIYNMVIIDFPGLKSSENKINHLMVQKSAIQNIQVKMICFVIKIDREGPMEKEINEMIDIFPEYKNNITIIITQTDTKPNFNEKIMGKIEKKISKSFGIKNVIFTNNKTNAYVICEQLNKIQNNMENIKYVLIKTNSLVNLINTKNKVFQPEVEKRRNIYEKKFNDILLDHQNEIKKANDGDLKLAIYFCFKSVKKSLLTEYGNTLEALINSEETTQDDDEEENEDMENDDRELEEVSTAIMNFDSMIYNKFEEFRKNVEKDIEIKINNYNGEYNKFKKCPHCGEIWFKIIGCDNMVCGNRTKIFDKFCGRFKKYEVTYDIVKRKFEIKSSDIEDSNRGADNSFTGLTKEEKDQNAKRLLEGKAEIKPKGCGNQLNWKEMEDCTEKVLAQLKENTLESDYYADIFDFYNNKKINK